VWAKLERIRFPGKAIRRFELGDVEPELTDRSKLDPFVVGDEHIVQSGSIADRRSKTPKGVSQILARVGGCAQVSPEDACEARPWLRVLVMEEQVAE
jgi:hypothetical protein